MFLYSLLHNLNKIIRLTETQTTSSTTSYCTVLDFFCLEIKSPCWFSDSIFFPNLLTLHFFPLLFSSATFSKMKLGHLNSIMNSCNHFRSSRTLLSLSFHSTTLNQRMGSLYPLYLRILPIVDPKVSIVPVLDQWVVDGGDVDEACLLFVAKELRNYRRYNHALEVPIFSFFVLRVVWMLIRYIHLGINVMKETMHLLFSSSEVFLFLVPMGSLGKECDCVIF